MPRKRPAAERRRDFGEIYAKYARDKAGDKAAWGPRIAKGKDVLYEHAIKGFQGSAGVMPAKGGRALAAARLLAAVGFAGGRSRSVGNRFAD